MCGGGAREGCPLWRLRLRNRVWGDHFHDDGIGFRAHGARSGKNVRLCHAQTGSPGGGGCQEYQASTSEIGQSHLLAQGAGQGLTQLSIQFVPFACLAGKRNKRLALAHVPGAVTGRALAGSRWRWGGRSLHMKPNSRKRTAHANHTRIQRPQSASHS